MTSRLTHIPSNDIMEIGIARVIFAVLVVKFRKERF